MCETKETQQDATPVIKDEEPAPIDESQVTPSGFAVGQFEVSGTVPPFSVVPPSIGVGELIQKLLAQAQSRAHMIAGLEIVVQYTRTVMKEGRKQKEHLMDENQSLNPEDVWNDFVAFVDNARTQAHDAIDGLCDEKQPSSGAQK